MRIIATGKGLPINIIDNKQLASEVLNYDEGISGLSLDKWIESKYGIKQRRRSGDNERPSNLAATAAQDAISKSGIDVKDIDFLILTTTTGDFPQPTTATLVQTAIGMKPSSFAIELNMACAGPVYALTIAEAFIASGKYETGLIIGVEQMTSIVDLHNFKTAGLFGDGAGACIVTKSEGNPNNTYLASRAEKGNEADYALFIPGGRSVYPLNPDRYKAGSHFLKMNGAVVKDYFIETVKDTAARLLSESNSTIADMKYVIFHQASLNLIKEGANALGINEEQLVLTLPEYGNTSSASILLTLDKVFQTLNRGDKVLLLGMGGGLNWGGIIYTHH
jgi:3-oxoacyl-(acyl-carrier-protein) synthase III